jgi:hypothetical protein
MCDRPSKYHVLEKGWDLSGENDGEEFFRQVDPEYDKGRTPSHFKRRAQAADLKRKRPDREPIFIHSSSEGDEPIFLKDRSVPKRNQPSSTAEPGPSNEKTASKKQERSWVPRDGFTPATPPGFEHKHTRRLIRRSDPQSQPIEGIWRPFEWRDKPNKGSVSIYVGDSKLQDTKDGRRRAVYATYDDSGTFRLKPMHRDASGRGVYLSRYSYSDVRLASGGSLRV